MNSIVFYILSLLGRLRRKKECQQDPYFLQIVSVFIVPPQSTCGDNIWWVMRMPFFVTKKRSLFLFDSKHLNDLINNKSLTFYECHYQWQALYLLFGSCSLSETVLSFIVLIHISFLSKSDGLSTRYKLDVLSLLKTNWADEAFRVLWWVLQIAHTTGISMSLHESSASNLYCFWFLVHKRSPSTLCISSSTILSCGFLVAVGVSLVLKSLSISKKSLLNSSSFSKMIFLGLR